jgi:IS30 family transposase
MSQITQQDLYAIQQKINSTPRKILGYKTPAEVLKENGG